MPLRSQPLEDKILYRRLHTEIMHLLYLLAEEHANRLREQHPTWTSEVLLDTVMKQQEPQLDLIVSGLVEAVVWRPHPERLEIARRYLQELYRSATKYQPMKAPQAPPLSSDQHLQTRLDWWKANELITAARRWTTLAPATKVAFLRTLTRKIDWAIRKDPERRALRRYAADRTISQDQAKEELLRTGATLVLARWTEAQTHRFGKLWATDDVGEKALIVPQDLGWLDGWTWFADEVRKAARASLLDEQYPALGTGDVLDRQEGDKSVTIPLDLERDATAYPDGGEGDPLATFLVEEERIETEVRLRAAVERVTPRQRQLLALIEQGHTIASAARALGMKESTARGHLHRLRNAM